MVGGLMSLLSASAYFSSCCQLNSDHIDRAYVSVVVCRLFIVVIFNRCHRCHSRRRHRRQLLFL
jgi:hypothetical protein